MHTINVVLSRSTIEFPLFSWIVQLVLRKRYSHSSIHYIDPRTEQRMVSETSKGEGHEMLYKRWKWDNKIVRAWAIRVTDEQFTEFKAISNSFKQVPYSPFLGMLGILIHILSAGKYAPFEDGLRTLFCSESDVYKLRAFGIYFIKDSNFVTPKDIEKKMVLMAEREPSRIKECYING